MNTPVEFEPYRNLAASIILQAFKDYKIVTNALEKAPAGRCFDELSKKAADILGFFESDYFLMLSGFTDTLNEEQLKKICESI